MMNKCSERNAVKMSRDCIIAADRMHDEKLEGIALLATVRAFTK